MKCNNHYKAALLYSFRTELMKSWSGNQAVCARQIGVGLQRGTTGMSSVLTTDPSIPRTELSSVDVDVQSKDWTDWGLAGSVWDPAGRAGNLFLANVLLKQMSQQTKRSCALCGRKCYPVAPSTGKGTILHILQHKCCWLCRKKPNKYLIAWFQLQSFSQCLDGFAIFTLQSQNLG